MLQRRGRSRTSGKTAPAVGLLLTLLALALPAGAAADDQAAGVLVRYRSGTTGAERGDTRQDAAVAREAGLPLPRLELDKPAAGVTVEQAVDALSRDPDVLYAEPNRVVHASLAANDNLFANEWGLNNTGQSVTSAAATPAPVAGADIHAEAAWELTTGDPSVVVGVVDTGVDATHPDLAANIWTNPREIPNNGRDDDGNGFVDDVHGWDFVGADNTPADITAVGGNPGHGSHVSGTIAARGNDGPGVNSGVAGVTWSSTIMPVRVLDQTGSGTLANVIAGYAYAARNGARIINASLGDFAPSPSERATIASFPNTLFVVAAGNDGANTDTGDQASCAAIVNSPTFDPANPPTQCSFPADYGLANIVSVAASDRADQLATFSNFGTRFIDLAAPGVTIWSTVPGGWRSLSGTSMATPHVAGVAALMLARDPTLSTAQLRQALLQGVDRKDSLAGKVASAGRLNALGALSAGDAIAHPPAPPAPPPPPPPPPPSDTQPPTAPTGLTATAASSSQVNLSWSASSDNVGVTGYEVRRAPAGGTPTAIATTTGTGTTFSDTTVAAGQSYDYQVVAKDAAGNASAPSNTAPVTVPPAGGGGSTLTFRADADSSVVSGAPNSNFGTSTSLLSVSGTFTAESYLRFTVAGVGTATVTSAKLRLFASDGTADGPGVYACTDPACATWTETGITWNNRPPRAPTATADLGAIATGTTAEWDVTPLVTGDGAVNVVVGPAPTSDAATFRSDENTTNQPQLVVTTG